MNTSDALRRFSQTWQRALIERELEPIVDLYAPGAVFASEPFREPYIGRDGVRAYVSNALAHEAEIHVYFGQPLVERDRGAIQWWGTLVDTGQQITVAGTSMMRFSNDGLVTEQWDSWSRIDEPRDPPDHRG